MPIWIVLLKAPNGGVQIEEVEADYLDDPDDPTDPDFDYVLKNNRNFAIVARFPRHSVLGIYMGPRRQFDITIEPAEKE